MTCRDCDTATYNLKCEKCLKRWQEVMAKYWNRKG